MSALVLDTHILIWSLFEPEKLSAPAQNALQQALEARSTLYVATISLIEIQYLTEKGRLQSSISAGIDETLDEVGSLLTLVILDRQIARSLSLIPRDLVPDMPDRIIAATALHLNLPLITADRMIQSAPITTIW